MTCNQLATGSRRPLWRGFTFIELLVVIAVIAILAGMALPALAKAKARSQGVGCMSNIERFTVAWQMYSEDYQGRVANNYGVNETFDAIQRKDFDNWANNVMTWGASSSVPDVSVTNKGWVLGGVLGPFLGGDIDVYKCPADDYLSPVQRKAGYAMRNRSISMNSFFGRFSPGNDSTKSGLNWAFNDMKQFLKQSDVPSPGKTWLVLDEQADSINDGYFVNNASVPNWQDFPASSHNGACVFAFADGHSEAKKWLSASSRYTPVRYAPPYGRSFDAAGKQDFAWYLARSGYIRARDGAPLYGH